MKLIADATLLSPAVTVIGPVVAPEGTVVMIWVDVQLVTIAALQLKLTILFDEVVLKLDPVMVTGVPARAPTGSMLVIVGDDPVIEEVLLRPQPPKR